MNKEQALQVIKLIIDEALKSGVLKSIEQANTIIQAFTIIQNSLKNDGNSSTSS